MSKEVKVVLAGEGGQGVQSVAIMITEAAFKQGKFPLYIPNFGVEQRGGVSVAFVQIADKPVSSLKFPKADVVVALSKRAVDRTLQYIDENTIFIYDSSIVDAHIPTNAKKVLSIPALEIVTKDFHPRVFNVLIMGAVINATHVVDMSFAQDALISNFQAKFDKDPALKKMNMDVLSIGAALTSGI